MKALLWLLLLMVCALGTGCRTEPALPPGVVAEVNKQFITLRQVEALHDVDGGSLIMAQSPSLDLLRSQYGRTLGTLMANALIEQALAARQQGVSEADVQAAEEMVRADYPADEFEKHLLEEYIDLEAWRELLRQRLSVLRFQEQVLRPMLQLTPDDVRAAYARKSKDLRLPRRVRLAIYTGVDKAQMDAVRAALATGQKPVSEVSLTVEELELPLDRLPPSWRQDLLATPTDSPTPVRQWEGFFQFFVAGEPTPERALTLVEAYAVIEQELIEDKLEPLFGEWLTDAVNKARIRVSPLLATEVKSVEKKTPRTAGPSKAQ